MDIAVTFASLSQHLVECAAAHMAWSFKPIRGTASRTTPLCLLQIALETLLNAIKGAVNPTPNAATASTTVSIIRTRPIALTQVNLSKVIRLGIIKGLFFFNSTTLSLFLTPTRFNMFSECVYMQQQALHPVTLALWWQGRLWWRFRWRQLPVPTNWYLFCWRVHLW